jgi:hypothetical protein
MKSIFYIIVVLFMGANFTSCTPEALVDQVEETATTGEDGEIGGEDEGGD